MSGEGDERLVSDRLLYDIYDALRSIEKYCDWDTLGYDDAVKAKYALGELLWPSG